MSEQLRALHLRLLAFLLPPTMTAPVLLSATRWFATVSSSMPLQAALALCLLATVGLVYYLRRIGTAWAMRRWACTSGRIITAEMRRGKKKNSDGSLLYDPVLRYSYAVGGSRFESTRFTHQAVSNAAQLATQFITRVQQDAEVPVYYDPQDPRCAVVHPMPWHGSALGAALCAVLALALTLCLAWV